MRGLVLVGLLAAAAHGAAAEAHGVRLPTPTTLATVPGYVEGFAQDGDRIVWATESRRCGRNVVLRTLSTGRSTFLDSRDGPMCRLMEIAGEVQPWMALAGTRALWAREFPSLSLWNFSVLTAAPGDRRERQVGGMALGHDPSDEHDGLRPVPMSGQGKALVFAEIATEEEEHPGVYRVIGNRAEHVPKTEGAFAVAVSGSRFALARGIPGGCACNSSPAWSPDGRRIAFLSGGGETDNLYGPWHLVVMNADGTNLRRILDDVTTFEWAPDGGSLAASQQQGAAERLIVLKPDGTGARTIAATGVFAWAPNGRQLAYVTQEGRLVVVAADGGAAVDLAEGGGRLEWSPDSQRLAYLRSVATDATHVYIVSVATGGVVDAGPGESSPAWAPDGSALAFTRKDGVYVAAPDGTDTHRVGSRTPDYTPSPRWSPDGRWIAYADGQAVWIVSPQGGPPRKLAEHADGFRGGPQWSPDAQAIAYYDYNNGLTVVDAATGVRRFSAQGFSGLEWSTDGNRLLGVANDEIAQIDTHNGAVTTLTHTDVVPPRTVVETHRSAGKLASSFDAPQDLLGIAWSGPRFALLNPRSKTQARIEIRSASGKLLRSVNVPRPWFDQFSMSGRWVVFRAGNSVRLVDAASGRMTVLAQAPKASIVGLSIDGRRVAWAESTYKRSRIRAVVLPVR